MINAIKIREIDRRAIERYNKRFEKFGIDPRTLGWGSENDQEIRFATAVKYVNFSNKSVLDIGCGFSDFYKFLLNNNKPIKVYKGIDINEKMVNASRELFPKNIYEVRNFLLDSYDTVQADIVTLFGLLNFKVDTIDNLDYTKEAMGKAWNAAAEVLVVDFLSTQLFKGYPKEDFVYYHEPKDILDICFSLTNNVVLVHDYPAIPQKEFMVILKREEA